MVEEITIRPATADDLQSLRALVTDVFVRNERMSAHLRLSHQAFDTFYDELTRFMDLDLTSVACTPSEGIVACMLFGPYNVPFEANRVHPSIGPLITVVEVLDGWFDDKFSHVPKDNILHLIMGATKDEYRYKRLGETLAMASIERARKQNRWDMVVVECTSSAPQHLMRDLCGFTVGTEVVYETVEMDGKRPFKGLKGSCMVMYTHVGRKAKL